MKDRSKSCCSRFNPAKRSELLQWGDCRG